MLTAYRRHQAPCSHRSRRFKNCKCPIWVQGSLRGEYVRRSLDLRSWEAAANLVRVNKLVLVGDCYPRTAEMIAKEGLEVKLLPVSEVAKLDAGLSCMSLRWAKQDEV